MIVLGLLGCLMVFFIIELFGGAKMIGNILGMIVYRFLPIVLVGLICNSSHAQRQVGINEEVEFRAGMRGYLLILSASQDLFEIKDATNAVQIFALDEVGNATFAGGLNLSATNAIVKNNVPYLTISDNNTVTIGNATSSISIDEVGDVTLNVGTANRIYMGSNNQMIFNLLGNEIIFPAGVNLSDSTTNFFLADQTSVSIQPPSGGFFGVNVAGNAILFDESTGQARFPITGANAGVLIGGDALWYRSAANEMRTPDAVVHDATTSLNGARFLGMLTEIARNLIVATTGDMTYNSTANGLQIYSGTEWRTVQTSP